MDKKTKQQIPEDLIDSVGEDLPTLEEIERFALDGVPPKSCLESTRDCAVKILLALTRKTFHPQKAEKLWQAIVSHEKWLAKRLERKPGISVATLDYLMNVIGEWGQAAITEIEQMKDLADAATLDGLTGLYMREVFESWLEKSVAENERYGNPLSLMMADIDDFKEINDTYGHQVGDKVLKKIGSDFLSNLRSADFAARYGGEELVAALPHTRLNSAYTVAEKIRRTVSDRFKSDFSVTISIGVACWQDGMKEPTDLVQAADKALYAAKEAGKNRVDVDQPG
jgi:diguanylate cyclase (GGDEF)-like protein